MVATAPAVTFLFTDIEASTRLWETEPARMADALARHDQLCRAAVEAHGGRLVKMTGDGLHAVFDDPASAVTTTLDLQRGMAAIGADCGIAFKVRCGLHAGIAQERDSDYFGSAVNRAARIMGAAHGGQILLSQAVVNLAREHFPDGTDLMHLGRVRLRDLAAPEEVWQLLHTDLPRTFPALRSLDSTPNNLPQQLTSFIGREREMAQLKHLLGTTRLLTLTGSGGCGKTRLTIQVAADLLESYSDGVWLVELAALSAPALVPQSVATVLGLKESPGKSLTQTLTEHLKSRHLLIVLDNAEHLRAACAELVDTVLRQCPQVVMLVTSRERLGVAGELTFRVPSLSTPEPERDATAASLSPYESVRLFSDRARLNLPQFAVTDQNAPTLASICHHLDGIPLAIELAAARVRSMSVEEVNQRLNQRFRLLTGGSSTAPRRQQTLRALIAWSYDLLGDADKVLLCRVSIFSGGLTLEAAEQVCVGDGIDDKEVLDLLTSLADKSLVVAEDRNGATRYWLLETVRQYAQELLRESGDEARWQGRHLAYFLAMAERAEPALVGSGGRDQSSWLEKLELEQDNFRAALTSSLGESQAIEPGLRLCGLLQRFWTLRAQSREGRKWCDAAIARASSDDRSAALAKALIAAGTLAYRIGDYSAARHSLEQALTSAKAISDRALEIAVHSKLALVALNQGNFAQAEVALAQALSVCQETGDRVRERSVLMDLANVAINRGDLDAATVPLESALSLSRDLNDPASEANALALMGEQSWQRGDLATAQASCEQSLSILRALGARNAEGDSLRALAKVFAARGEIAQARGLLLDALAASREHGDPQYLDQIAVMAMTLSKPEDAARFAGAADALRHAFGLITWPIDRKRFHEYRERCRNILGAKGYDALYATGRALGADGVVEMTRRWLEELSDEFVSH